MEQREFGGLEQKRRCRRWLLVFGVVLVVVLVLALVLGLILGRKSGGIEKTFLKRCQKFKDLNCQNVWDAFQQAYINRDPCNVPMEAYDPFIKAVYFKPQCGKTLLWSKTKDVAHSFTQERDCFKTLEDTPLGALADGLTWCGKQGSNETFTTGCPEWSECDNPVRSFWYRASAALADAACGDVTAMLSGSIQTPFSPGSIFESIEVKRLRSPNVKQMNVVLVIDKDAVTNCTNGSLEELQKALDDGIGYNCKEVTKAQINKCSSDPAIVCSACW